MRRRWLADFVLLSSRTCAACMHAGNQNVDTVPTEWYPSRARRIKWPLGSHCTYGHHVKWVGIVWLAGRSTAARTCRILGAHKSHDSLIEHRAKATTSHRRTNLKRPRSGVAVLRSSGGQTVPLAAKFNMVSRCWWSLTDSQL